MKKSSLFNKIGNSKYNIQKPLIIFWSLSCINSSFLFAQKNGTYKTDKTEIVYRGNHFGFNLGALSTYKAKLKNRLGNHPINANSALGLLLSFYYHVNFNPKYSIVVGTEMVITGRNFITSFNKTEFSPPLIKDYKFSGRNSYTSDLTTGLAVLIQKRKFYAVAKHFFAETGIRLNVSTGDDFDDFSISLMRIDSTIYNAGGVYVYSNNDARPWISFPMSIGHGWQLKNNNALRLSLISNISFTKYVKGIYRLIIPNKPLTEGNYSLTGSYIGLSLNYVFTNANYRISKEYESERKTK